LWGTLENSGLCMPIGSPKQFSFLNPESDKELQEETKSLYSSISKYINIFNINIFEGTIYGKGLHTLVKYKRQTTIHK
jgi:hypothetical protein